MRTAVLDHGYVELVETWGSDERIIEAARMSTSKGFLGWGPLVCEQCKYSETPGTIWQQQNTGTGSTSVMVQCPKCEGTQRISGDEKLLKYLYTHKHMTPFEMAGMTIEVQAPIFVFREWHRHRTQSYNEMSSRYTELPELCYVPSDERILSAKQSKSNKQGSEGFAHDDRIVKATVRAAFTSIYQKAWAEYQEMLELGVARELASRVLPVAQYSKMRASANLRNWLGFLTLRMDPAAQWEIRQFANEVAGLISHQFPRTYKLFAGTP